MATHNIHLKIENPTLHRVIAEQLAIFKTISVQPDIAPDCIITEQGTSTTTIPKGCTHLEISKGAVRLGEIMDKLNYLLSGREAHIENALQNIQIGDLVLVPAENILTDTKSGTIIRLTDKERLLLRFLYEAGDAGMPRKDLLKSVWGYADEAETHTLETHIYRLRQKIEAGGIPNFITVQDGVYRLA